jgi:hypothetical protein
MQVQDEAYRLRDLQDKLRSEHDVLRGAHQAICSERDLLRGKQDALYGERDALRRECDSTRSERDTLRGKYDTLHDERDALRTERDLLRGAHDGLRSERDALRNERDVARGERDAQRGVHEALRGKYDALHGEYDALRGHLNWHVSHQAHLEQVLAQQQADLQAILFSRSWQVTRPLRWLVRQLRQVHSLPRRAVRQTLLVALHLVRDHRGVRRLATGVMALAPARVRNRLTIFAQFHPPQHIHTQDQAAIPVVAAPAPSPLDPVTLPIPQAPEGAIPAKAIPVTPAYQKSNAQIIYSRLRVMITASEFNHK